ncbi:extracellular mutant protein 11-domain-containing protein [Rhexocercosporidium sp. MPI-PUGE-AT-0058]|nr:extracellular mutant protein 11-domain-containing protein [Rhexocercosporidium sp. MPI-PUGE-AT-0058]
MNRFVTERAQNGNGRALTPPLAQPVNKVRPERAPAQGLKISMKSGNSAPASIDPTPVYASNKFGERNIFSNNQYQQVEYNQDIDDYHKETQYRKDALEDTTVASDFDRTKSDIGFQPEPEQYYDDVDGGFSADEDNGYAHPDRRPYVEHAGTKEVHTIQYKQSRSPLVNNKAEHPSQRQQPFAIAGRFEGNKQHQNLQLRNGNGNTDSFRDQGSRKRSRSRDVPRAPVARGSGPDILDDEEDADDLEYPNGHPDATVRFVSNQISSDRTEQATPVPSPTHQRRARTPFQSSQNLQDPANPHAEQNKIDDRLIPDYSTEELKRMTYSDLKSESWDMVPHAKPFKLPDELQGRKVTLEKKMAYYIKMDQDKVQYPFYESLTTEEWDQAGDIFIDKLGELMKKLKAKKKEKREVAEQFEEEINQRQRAVQVEAGKIDQRLDGMAITGQSLLRSK